MITTGIRLIKYAFQHFKRNVWLSTATILVMVLALSVFAGLNIFNVTTTTIIENIQDKIDISIFFTADTPEDEILRIQTSVQELEEVKATQYISKDQALEIFKERHGDDETISQALQQLSENPLLASLNIKAQDSEQYAQIAAYLENESIKQYTERVTYGQNATVIERLNTILNIAEQGGFALTIFMALIAVLITFNTIRLAIYSSKDSIMIMRLVGGSNFFIRGPFLIEGIIYGILAAVISLLIIAPLIYLISPYSNVLVPELDLWVYFTDHLPTLLIYQLLFGSILGLISSFIAIGKYLKAN